MLKKAREAVSKAVSKLTGAKISYEFDMTTREKRQRQVARDYDRAKVAKAPHVEALKKFDNYYNNQHFTAKQVAEIAAQLGITGSLPVLPDPFIQVESQVQEVVPTPQFSGREGMDHVKAKEREDVVRYLLYINNIEELNLENERALRKTGDAFWKVAWDPSVMCRGPSGEPLRGEIVIGNPDAANIFHDPSAYTVDECEFIIFAYRMHRRKARRAFGKVIDKIDADSSHADTEIYTNAEQIPETGDETLQVVEYWYKDDEGDIALSIQIDEIEVKHIPKYWSKTRHSGNRMYPIVKYQNIPKAKSFWGRGEVETIIDLVDAANRGLIQALLNDMLMNNDVVIMDEGAMPDGEEWDNRPGAVNRVTAGKSVRRLGGVANNTMALQMVKFLHEKIEETNGNYVSSYGKEPARVTTASGIAQLNERAEKQTHKKNAGREAGYRRLMQLLDWTALEFYTEDRLINIRGDKQEEDRMLIFNSNNYRMEAARPKEMFNPEATEQEYEPEYYYPKVDVEVQVGEGIAKSKAFTLAVTQELSQIQITPFNAPLVKMVVELLELPNEADILEAIDRAAEMAMQQAGGQAGAGGGMDALMKHLDPQQQEFVKQMLASLPEQEQAAFLKLPLEQQVEAIAQAAQG